MSQITRDIVEDALRQVADPGTQQNVIDSGLISGIAIKDGHVRFVITIALADKDRKSGLRDACENTVKKLSGVTSVTAVLTAESSPAPDSTAAKKPAQWNLTPVEGVTKIIAVASGKGGVGKSTTAVNLALAFQAAGKRVGILDADIYGPSVPHMMGISGKPDIIDGKMMPLENHRIKCMSIGFITNEAAVMRGPMISKTLYQLLRLTDWKPLDVLIVDMPPGTGDIHLSMVQQVPLAGAVIVTTPQEIALIDARKCISMFKKTGTPVLGVIENMSGSIFGSGGGEKLAEEWDVPFLGSIGMDAQLPKACDGGEKYTGINSAVYLAIAKILAE